MSIELRQIVYQIFPERFAIGGGLSSQQKLAIPAYQQAAYRLCQWDEPVLPVDEDERRSALRQAGKTFYGGDLAGVSDRLDYLQQLGVTTLYFTPLFEAPSNHKYDAVTFDRIDPMFGGEAALTQLLQHLQQRQMGLIMDAAFNHVSDQHPWFKAAQAGQSPWRDWFLGETADDGSHQFHYWWGFRHMPELNLAHPGLQEQLMQVLRHYLDMGIQGWRFDTGQDIGLPFVARMRRALHDFPQAELLGELMNYAGDWIGPQAFTGIMNYYQRTALLAWLDGRIGSRQAHIALREGYAGHGHAGSLRSWNMLASHDTPRLRHLLPDWHDRQLALVAQFALPGIPVIYYGEENGMDGGPDPDCRRPMQWDEAHWDWPVRQFYQQLIQLRQQHPALWQGRMQVLGDRLDHGDALIWLRHTGRPGESALIVLNRGHHALDAQLMLPDSHLYSTVPLLDALGNGQPARVDGGLIRLQVPARCAAIFLPHEPVSNYRYFKARNRSEDDHP